MLQIKFFHKVGSMNAPVTDSEKLVWSVLEAERQTIRFYDAIIYFFSFFYCLSGADIYIFRLIYDVILTFSVILCSQLHGKSLFEANNSFLEKHEGHTHYIMNIWMTHFELDCEFLVSFPCCLQIL